jgi:hypothetical protein
MEYFHNLISNWLSRHHAVHTSTEPIQFASLGLAVLDDIWIGSSEIAKEVLGGSGAYGVVPFVFHLADLTLTLRRVYGLN